MQNPLLSLQYAFWFYGDLELLTEYQQHESQIPSKSPGDFGIAPQKHRKKFTRDGEINHTGLHF